MTFQIQTQSDFERLITDMPAATTNLDTLFIVPARDSRHVREKLDEIESMKYDVKVICGDKIDDPRVVYRKPIGKWDAINFSFGLVDESKEIIVFNDVDTKISGLEYALEWMNNKNVDMVYGTETVLSGPQSSWFKLMNRLRGLIPIASSGELLVIRKSALKSLMPMPPCMAEDTYILFKLLEHHRQVVFEPRCKIVTERTLSEAEEVRYKRRTLLGIYQALHYSRPPAIVRFFYAILPFMSILLIVNGRNGIAWAKGIIRAYAANIMHENTSKW